MAKEHGNRKVFALEKDGYVLMRLAEARRRDLYIAVCSLCDKNYAAYLDHYAPYYENENRCAECFHK